MIYVKAWGEDIGQLVEHKGIIKFKYSDTNVLDFSPIKMPMKNKQVYEFSHLACIRRSDSYTASENIRTASRS